MRNLKADLRAALKTAVDAMNLDNLLRAVEAYAARRAMAAEERVKELEDAIHAECGRCAAVRARLGCPEDCDWNTCPLWPHRPGANREEMERDAKSKV